MKKYIIAVDGNQFFFTAASKAREDAEAIARKCGYERFSFTGERTANRNLLTAVPFVVFGLVAWVVALPLRCLGVLGEVLGAAFAAVAVGVGVICTLAVMYGYRQAWFIKNERPDAPAIECLRSSYRMMNGFRWRAFCLDFSFVGWFVLVAFLFLGAGICMHVAQSVGVPAVGWLSYMFSIVLFFMLIKGILGVAVARVVFYRELK